jgi:succinate dehydrogenase hydrophobic anchor subunit
VKGLWPWLLQRVTAAALVVALFLHLWATHFSSPGAEIVFAGVTVRVRTLLYMVVDFSLLALVLFHGLNGLRNVVLDFGVRRCGAAWLTVGLCAVGLVWLILGVFGLLPFIAVRG